MDKIEIICEHGHVFTKNVNGNNLQMRSKGEINYIKEPVNVNGKMKLQCLKCPKCGSINLKFN
jgi:hypothetical protein